MKKLLLNLAILSCTFNVQADNSFAEKYLNDNLSIHVTNEHYAWSGNNKTSGWQNVTPITATYRTGNAELGVRTAYIFSENTSLNRGGRVSTLSDTALSFAYSQPLPEDFTLRFNLDYNAPTGKATLSGAQRNAVMDGSLVQQTRFGEGHNVNPGFVLTKAFGQNASVGVGLSHTIRGSYDPNGDVLNDRLDPGDETRASLQGQYGTQNWLVAGGLIYTRSGTTEVNHQKYFRKGDRFDVNLSSFYVLPYEQKISGSFRYGVQTPDKYVNSISGNLEKESRNVNGDNLYLSLEYAKTFLTKHTIKVLADWMRVDKNSYDQFSGLYYAGREKWQVGLGYDYQFDPKKHFYFIAKNMEMRDKATPITLVDTKYSGWTISAGLDWRF